MFSRICFIFILFVGQIVSSENKSESKFQSGFNDFEKKVIIPLGVGIAVAVLSEKAVFLHPDARYLSGALEDSLWLFPVANFKLISILLSQNRIDSLSRKIITPRIISVKNGQRIYTLISALHGCLAAAVCRYGLNRFFPS